MEASRIHSTNGHWVIFPDTYRTEVRLKSLAMSCFTRGSVLFPLASHTTTMSKYHGLSRRRLTGQTGALDGHFPVLTNFSTAFSSYLDPPRDPYLSEAKGYSQCIELAMGVWMTSSSMTAQATFSQNIAMSQVIWHHCMYSPWYVWLEKPVLIRVSCFLLTQFDFSCFHHDALWS